MGAPLFSIVCAAYNAELTVDQTVHSVLRQTHENFELLVVDDGSSDQTASRVAALAAGDDRVRLIRQANARPAGARNRGLIEARGELISFVDSDDLWLSDYLSTIVRASAEAPGAGLYFSDLWMFDDRARRVHRGTLERVRSADSLSVIPSSRLEVELLLDNFVPTSATTMTREALDATGGFDASPSLYGAEDWDLWLRVAHAGFGAVKIPEAHAVWRDRAGSESKKSLMMAQGAIAAVQAAMKRNPGAPEVEAAAKHRTALIEREIAEMTDATFGLKTRAQMRRRASTIKHRLLRSRDWIQPPEGLRRELDLLDPPYTLET